ncbi:hypothetical protein [Paraburkholderia sp. BCC1885]|uniref:hypothetical protein n=1 Tax=Paraburkholderia sp. BCC1885 TaxID=2562669 RepID=UPI001181FBC1|nr:hypothetical protein [Paraburkholderia sp. BCC1885]
MKPATITMLRAYLLTASLAAAAIQVGVLASIGFLGISEDVFTSATFRLAVLAIIACIVLVVKRMARAAFVRALSYDYAVVTDAPSRKTSVSPVCPGRVLVILHLLLNRRPIEWVAC